MVGKTRSQRTRVSALRATGFLVICLAAILLGSCTGVLRRSPIMKAERIDIRASAEELRRRVRAVADDFSTAIAEGADRILSATTDTHARREALLWKINGVPSMQAAIFEPDPLGALADTWLLCVQMKLYYQEGLGGEVLGAHRAVAVEVSQQMEERMEQIVKDLFAAAEVQPARATIYDWARTKPLRNAYYGRESAITMMRTAPLPSGLNVAGQLAQDINDLQERLSLYNKHLPHMLRWHAELMALDVNEEAEIGEHLKKLETTLDHVGVLSASIERLSPVLDQTPQTIERERTAALEALSIERQAVQEFVSATSMELADRISMERSAVAGEITEQRKAILLAVQLERGAIFEAIRTERASIVQDAEAAAGRIVDQAAGRVEQLMNELLLKAVLLIGAATLLVLGGLYWVRRRSAPG